MNPWKLLKDQLVIGKKIDENFYAAALDEFRSGQLRPGLMAKAIVQSDGDEQKAKAVYIRLLADKIRDDQYLVSRANEESLRTQQQADHKIRREQAPRAAQPDAEKKGYDNWIGLIILLVIAAAWLLPWNKDSAPAVAAPPPIQSQNSDAPSNYDKVSAPAVAAPPLAQSQNGHAPSSYDKLLTSFERQYPQINPDSAHFDARLTNQIAKRMSKYRASGHSENDALKLAVRDFISQNTSQSKYPGSYDASRKCEIKPVMTNEDYRRCGITPPSAR